MKYLYTTDLEEPVVFPEKALEEMKKVPGVVFTTGKYCEYARPLLDIGWAIQVHTHPRFFGYEHDKLKHISDVGVLKSIIEADRTAVEKTLNVKTTCFRAGKLSMNPIVEEAVRKLGFLADSSRLVPHVFRLTPYWEPYMHNGLLEIPIVHCLDREDKDINFNLKRIWIGLTASAPVVCLLHHPKRVIERPSVVSWLSRLGTFISIDQVIEEYRC